MNIELLLSRLEHNVAATPNRIIYRYLSEGLQKETFTFLQLDSAAKIVANAVSQYAGQGETVMLMFPPGIDFIPSLIGTMMSGAIAVPVHPPRRSRRIDSFRAMVDQARPRVILTTDEVLPTIELALAEIGQQIPVLLSRGLSVESTRSFVVPTSEQVAVLQFTSGSTGSPKGVVITHGNIVANQIVIQAAFGYEPGSCIVSWLPMFHDMGLFGAILPSLYVGFPTVLMSPQAFLREPLIWLKAISDFRGTSAGGPNFAFEHCLKNIPDSAMNGIDLSSWKTAFNGAEPVRESTLKSFAERFSRCGFDAKAFLPCYGMAETTLMVSGGPSSSGWRTLPRPVSHASQNPSVEESIVSCGSIATGFLVRIVSTETFKVLPDGSIGEIWVSGPSVAIGYWQNE